MGNYLYSSASTNTVFESTENPSTETTTEQSSSSALEPEVQTSSTVQESKVSESDDEQKATILQRVVEYKVPEELFVITKDDVIGYTTSLDDAKAFIINQVKYDLTPFLCFNSHEYFPENSKAVYILSITERTGAIISYDRQITQYTVWKVGTINL